MTSASEPVNEKEFWLGSVCTIPMSVSTFTTSQLGGLTASHFMEFSGVKPPNSRIVTAESVASLKRFESEHVPKKTFPLALKRLFRPVAAGVGEELVVVATAPGWHWE